MTMAVLTNPWVVAIVASLVAGLLLYFVFGVGKPKPMAESRVSPVTPDEIVRQLDDVPAYRRREVAQAYAGLRVRWILRFHDLYRFNFRHVVQAYPQQSGSMLLITFHADLGRQPELKLMKRKEEFVVEGTVASVDGHTARLKKCHLSFGAAHSVQESQPIGNTTTNGPSSSELQVDGPHQSDLFGLNSESSLFHVTPSSIAKRFESLQPSDTTTALLPYLGMEVMWTLVLVEAETVDAHRVIKGHAPGDQTTVLCTVALPDYPLADTIVRDQEFTIRGTVDGIGAHAIELFDCELLFPM